MSKTMTLATAGSIEALQNSVNRFYCGEEKQIIPAGNEWAIYCPITKRELESVRIVKKRGRYRFVMID